MSLLWGNNVYPGQGCPGTTNHHVNGTEGNACLGMGNHSPGLVHVKIQDMQESHRVNSFNYKNRDCHSHLHLLKLDDIRQKYVFLQ